MVSQNVEEQFEVWSNMYRLNDAAYQSFKADGESLGMLGSTVATRNYAGRLIEAMQGKNPIVWFNLTFNPEILYAMDIVPICIQILGALYGFTQQIGKVVDLIDYAESIGVPSDLCSVDKMSTAIMMRKLLPRPACHIGINAPCDSQVFSAQSMIELEPAPQFFIDVPYYKDERSIKYVAGQIKELIPFLSRHTGRKFDIDKLREACELSNRMVENMWEWMEWRKHIPVVQPSKLCQMGLYLTLLSSGCEDGLIWSEGLKREAKEKALRNETVINERVRAIWYQDAIAWDLMLYDWMEKVLGLTIPMDLFGYFARDRIIDTSTLDSMLYGLARKNVILEPMSRQFMYNFEFFVQDLMIMVEEFQADCAIYAGHLGCKHGWAATGLLREACRKADIPLLVFEFDMFDHRVMGQEELKSKLTQFVEDIVWPRKQSRQMAGV